MSNRLKIAICEDKHSDALSLAELIRLRGMPCEIAVFSSSEEMLSSGGRYDILFLDIYMGRGMSGVELARALRQGGASSEIVFTTVSDAHALEGFEVNALQYLVKPVKAPELFALLERYVSIRDRRDLNYCVVVVDKEEVRLYHSDIYYIEAFDKYCAVHTANGEIKTYAALGGLLERLPTPPFLRCHRSFVVNMNYIKAAGRDFIMNNGDTVYIRQNKHSHIIKEYTTYLADVLRREIDEQLRV